MSTPRASGLALLTAAATLFLQVLVHRMVSVKLLNNYAFLVISLTMLGFALSGVILSFGAKWFLNRLRDASSLCAAIFVVSVVGTSMIFYRTHTAGQFALSRPEFVAAFFRWLPFALLFALPFACCGLILGGLLARPDLPVGKVYFADLLGSAAGAMGVIPAISRLGVEASTLGVCLFFLLGTFFLCRPRSTLPRLAGGAAAVVLLLAGLGYDRVFALYYPEGSLLAATRDPESGVVLEHAVWDPLARIEVSRIRPPDPNRTFHVALTGENPAFLARLRRMFTQNNYSFMYAIDYDGNLSSLTGIEETLYSAGYHATSVSAPRVLIIGVGGGFDVLTSLYFGGRDITGVEVNAATVGILTRTYREYFRSWVKDSHVHLVQGEARQFLASPQEPFDIIQLSGVDSFSGTPAAAHVFSENYLYTAQAFDLYLSRLSEEGILVMMRLEYPQPREMLRALTTAVGALRRAGVVRPADHILMLTTAYRNITCLLVKRKPFGKAEQRRVQAWAEGSPLFAVAAGPGLDEARANAYQEFLASGDPGEESAFIASYPYDISPVDDDRPFFFRHSFWWHVFPSNVMIWATTPVMEYSLILLLGVVGLAVLLCVGLPLHYFARQGLASPGAGRFGLFFAGTGLGYLVVEVALLQKFGLFLGHPNYALSVVLAALLFTSGVGALYSVFLTRIWGGVRWVGGAVAGLLLLEQLLVIPRLGHLLTLPFEVRATIVFLLVAPIGAGLGTFLPTGLAQLKEVGPAFVPWAWGINGSFSVLAPVLAVGVSETWGISYLLFAGAAVYLVVGWTLPPGIPPGSAGT